MIYYPKANITPDLFSNGTLTLKGSKEPYTGYYFTTFDNKAFTGPSPGDGVNLELNFPSKLDSQIEPSKSNYEIDYRFVGPNNYTYSATLLKLSLDSTPSPLTPTKYYPTPQDSDYQTGEFQRYFSKKINENIYTETKLLFQSTLYIGFSIPWMIRGNVDNVAQVNQRIVALKEAELGVLGLGLYLKNNYIQFYK